jgi:hypothetical protein
MALPLTKHVRKAMSHAESAFDLLPTENHAADDFDIAIAQVHATLAVANAMLAVAAELDWANTNRRDS